MIKYATNILIEFPMIVDTDIGFLRVADLHYGNEEIMYEEITSMKNTKHLKGLLMQRTVSNPLQVAFVDESDEQCMDDLYNKIAEERYDEVLKYSNVTHLFSLACLFTGTNGVITPTILCKDIREYKLAKELLSECPQNSYSIIVKKDKKDYNAKAYTDIMVKDANDLIYYDNLYGKNIYVANMVYNYDLEKFEKQNKIFVHPMMNISTLSNEVRFVTIYNYTEDYFLDEFYNDYLADTDDSIEMSNPEKNEFITNILGDVSMVEDDMLSDEDFTDIDDTEELEEDEDIDMFDIVGDDLSEPDYDRIFSTITKLNEKRR